MKLNKKTLAYILIGLAAVGGLYYLLVYNKSSESDTLTSTTAAAAWDSEDQALYDSFRTDSTYTAFNMNGWFPALVKKNYEQGTTNPDWSETAKIQGKTSKSGAWLQTWGTAVGNTPNDKAKQDYYDKIWTQYFNFKAKYDTL